MSDLQTPSFTENFMNGAKDVHVQSLHSEFSARRFAGWALVVFSILLQGGLAIWLSLDLSSLQEDIHTYNTFIAINRTTPNLGQSQCSVDMALNSAAAPKPVQTSRIQNSQYKILVLVLSAMFCVFGLIALSPNPFKSFNLKAFKLSATT